MNKAGIINHLAAVHGYRNYLELCTLTTGPGKEGDLPRAGISHFPVSGVHFERVY